MSVETIGLLLEWASYLFIVFIVIRLIGYMIKYTRSAEQERIADAKALNKRRMKQKNRSKKAEKRKKKRAEYGTMDDYVKETSVLYHQLTKLIESKPIKTKNLKTEYVLSFDLVKDPRSIDDVFLNVLWAYIENNRTHVGRIIQSFDNVFEEQKKTEAIQKSMPGYQSKSIVSNTPFAFKDYREIERTLCKGLAQDYKKQYAQHHQDAPVFKLDIGYNRPDGSYIKLEKQKVFGFNTVKLFYESVLDSESFVKRSSQRYKDIVRLSESLILEPIQNVYGIQNNDLTSKSQFDNYSFDIETREHIRDDSVRRNLVELLHQALHNKKEWKKYLKDVENVHGYRSESIVEDKSMPYMAYQRIERKLCSAVIKEVHDACDFIVVHEMSYTSPAGRNHYEDSMLYSLVDFVGIFKQMREYERNRDHIQEERRKMTKGLRYDIIHRDGGRCLLCGHSAEFDGVKLEVDHIKPVSKGGLTTKDNLQTLCHACNNGKRAKYDPILDEPVVDTAI